MFLLTRVLLVKTVALFDTQLGIDINMIGLNSVFNDKYHISC